jgi:hypothetical protein
MREYIPVGLHVGSDNVKEFVINNLNAISASIKSILTQVRSNKDSIGDAEIRAWTTAQRPKSTKNTVVIGVNLTTGNLNYTTDSGKNWKNYDGTAA